jgi:outer membrane protein OmpA-like peptidoglycan-associated protein
MFGFTLQPVDLEYKIEQVKFFLNQHSMKHLKIFGYSYSSSGGIEAQQLSLERAKAVQRALIDQGIDQSRLHIIETTNLPPGIDAVQPSWLRRCVVLELIAPR